MKWQVVERYLDFTSIPDGRVEFVCEHGVGHSPHWSHNRVHGCDGCCVREDFPGREPRIYDLALCGHGWLGLITSAERKLVTYPDGNEAQAYVGVHLAWERVGEPWSSRNPCIVGEFNVKGLGIRLVKHWPFQELKP